MDKIGRILARQSKLGRYQKPLEAARVCDIARAQASGQYTIVSFKNGLLTVAAGSPTQAANLQTESAGIIEKINNELGRKAVEKIRFKIE